MQARKELKEIVSTKRLSEVIGKKYGHTRQLLNGFWFTKDFEGKVVKDIVQKLKLFISKWDDETN
jgi:hypothetical protein